MNKCFYLLFALITKKGVKKCNVLFCRFLDLKQILPMCVQRAISMVRDRGDGGYQTTYRISLVLKILRNNDGWYIALFALKSLIAFNNVMNVYYFYQI
jgi:hypothetical protein